MQEPFQEPTDIGVIVGRFQVHDLHSAHIDLIQHVLSKHKNVILFLGIAPVLLSMKNMLNFPIRKVMMEQLFENKLIILGLPDVGDNERWSIELDKRVREVFPMGSVTMYGSRDSFLKYYEGKFHTQELIQTVFISGTEVRNKVSKEILKSSDFRAGIIHANTNRYPISYQTVDIAIFNSNTKELLLAKKPGESFYRFVGGFVDPTDNSLEEASLREAKEETNLDCINPKYIGSFRVDDWRYRGEVDKIMTALFISEYKDQTPDPMDDIEEVRLFKIDSLTTEMIVKTHQPLFVSLLQYLKHNNYNI